MTERYFPRGEISAANFAAARLAARLKLRPIKAFFRKAIGVEAVGTSGTIISTEAVARELGIIESNDLTPAALEELIGKVLEFERIEELKLPALSERRAQVWPGGLAILVELTEVLRIGHLKVSDGALREGLLYDMLGRLQHKDARERSIKALAARYNVDPGQAGRVATLALHLHGQVASQWQLESELATRAVAWAAQLHEIGLDISHDGFERHGAYVAQHADMPGFPRSEQLLLSFLIASQRSDIKRAQLKLLPEAWRERALKLAVVLRLAVLLNRSRGGPDLSALRAAADGAALTLEFPAGWLDSNPLTAADLAREQGYLRAVRHKLRYR